MNSQPGRTSYTDDIFVLMQRAKEDDLGLFVGETTSPELAFVLARDRQLDDLVWFCTPNQNFSTLTVDPTFDLGKFDVTPVKYKHGLVVSVTSGKPPVFIGLTYFSTLPQDIRYILVFCCRYCWSSFKVTSSQSIRN